MIISGLVFYIFATVIVASAVMVISSRNPVHSVLFLILAFLNAAGLFVLMGAEFLAWILVIVYVGAVAVLFLFVVMMLNINAAEMRRGVMDYLPTGALVGLVLLIEIAMIVMNQQFGSDVAGMVGVPTPAVDQVTNTKALGDVLYTRYIYLFEAAGIILLIAMIGAIVLTLRGRPGVRRQRIPDQIGRRREEAVELKKVTPGSGV